MKKFTILLLIGSVLFGYIDVLKAQIRVANGGNIGIGLTSSQTPQTKLEVRGSARFYGVTNFNNATNIFGTMKIQAPTLMVADPNFKMLAADGGNIYINIGSASLKSNASLQVNGITYLLGRTLITNDPAKSMGSTSDFQVDAVSSFNRKVYFKPNSSCPAFVFNSATILTVPAVYHTVLEPETNYTGYLGTSQKRFSQVYSRYVYYEQIAQASDERMKKNIRLAKKEEKRDIKNVNIYTYDFNEKMYEGVKDLQYKKLLEDEAQNKTGVMAQELQQIFPELVLYDEEADIYSVNYVGLIPHIIMELQSQNKIIESKTDEIEDLKDQVRYLQLNCCKTGLMELEESLSDGKKIKTKVLSEESPQTIGKIARLDQNIPNPFREETFISYFVPENTKKAGIYIYNLLGTQIRKIDINGTGEGKVVIRGNELPAGIYIYALIIDNEAIDTRKMILTD